MTGPTGIGMMSATGAIGHDCKTCACSTLYGNADWNDCEDRQQLMFEQEIKDCWTPLNILLIRDECELP